MSWWSGPIILRLGRSPKNIFIVVDKLTEITSHGSTRVKIMYSDAGLEVQGYHSLT